MKRFAVIRKGIDILFYRLQTQGLGLILLWLYDKIGSTITGAPLLKYCQITPQIYVGPQYRGIGKRKLERCRINGSLNLRKEFDDSAHHLDLQYYCYLPTENDRAPTLSQLEKGIAFIRKIIAKGGKVYIHCNGGISRAPAMAAAYFISRGYTLDEAIQLIKKMRAFIHILPEQMDQLNRFQERQRRGVR